MSEPATPELAKLSVPQLRALCRDKKLTGYSKLTKAGLLQILGAVSNPAGPIARISHSKAAPVTERPSGSTTSRPKPPGAAEEDSSFTPTSSETLPTTLLATTINAPSGIARPNLNPPAIPITLVKATPNTLGSSDGLTNIENIPSAKPPQSFPNRRSTPILLGLPDVTRTPTPVPLSPANGSINRLKRPRVLLKPSSPQKKAKTAHISTLTSIPPQCASFEEPSSSELLLNPRKAPTSLAVVNRVRSNQTLKSGGARFKPLVIKKPLPVTTSRFASSVASEKAPSHSLNTSVEHHLTSTAGPSELRYLELPVPSEVSSLKHITLPPSLSQRKRIQRWALVLSYVHPVDRKNCCLVSRMFRYALYLSAISILKREFSGKRLDEVLRQYSPSMSNFWPYLRLRQSEVKERHQVYQKSFFGRILLGREPLAHNIWASGDHQKQLTIALRFLLTRLWFATSVGGKEQDAWLQEKVVGVHEVVPDQIWMIDVLCAQQRHAQSLYILDATCEVVGSAQQPSDPLNCEPVTQTMTSTPLRADWTAFIQRHVANKSMSPLLTHLKWAHLEEYDKGISRFWLKRIEFEGELGSLKRTVAEKYVLACVVANGLSGHWMTTTEMAQESAGLTSRIEGSSRRDPEINLFLPAHHHVESVHFTTSKRVPLHPAIAVIQTLSREYFVLRDNGMEIGCEEEGVRGVWMHLLRCTNKGLPLWTA